jgi:hypothetical protein
VRNINPDLNDKKVWMYCQGMKNPGLKPFQLEGPPPLKMKVPPGKSPYLSALLSSSKDDPRQALAFRLFDEGGKNWTDMIKEVGCARGTFAKYKKRWDTREEAKKANAAESAQDAFELDDQKIEVEETNHA